MCKCQEISKKSGYYKLFKYANGVSEFYLFCNQYVFLGSSHDMFSWSLEKNLFTHIVQGYSAGTWVIAVKQTNIGNLLT